MIDAKNIRLANGLNLQSYLDLTKQLNDMQRHGGLQIVSFVTESTPIVQNTYTPVKASMIYANYIASDNGLVIDETTGVLHIPSVDTYKYMVFLQPNFTMESTTSSRAFYVQMDYSGDNGITWTAWTSTKNVIVRPENTTTVPEHMYFRNIRQNAYDYRFSATHAGSESATMATSFGFVIGIPQSCA